MKKHLLALAALATVSGMVAAQNVTVYGFIDAGVMSTTNGNSAGKSRLTAAQLGGFWFPSMYGLTGTEDLGGGMKASFNLQGSLGAMDGSQQDGNNIFGRYSSVTLSGAAGSVEAGRQIDLLFMQSFVNGVMPTHSNSLAVNGLLRYGGGDRLAGLSVSSSNTTTAGNTNASRINNAVTYTTPTVSGVTGKFMYAFGGVAGDSSAGSIKSGVLTANVSGVALSAGYETQDANNGVSNAYHKSLLGAKYTVGLVDLAGQYHNYKSSDNTINTNAYEAGVAYHFTPAATVGLNYEAFDDKYSHTKPKVTSVKAKYDLSKRTYLYTMAARYNAAASVQLLQGYATNITSGSNLAPDAANKTATNFTVGLVHGF